MLRRTPFVRLADFRGSLDLPTTRAICGGWGLWICPSSRPPVRRWSGQDDSLSPSGPATTARMGQVGLPRYAAPMTSWPYTRFPRRRSP